MLATDQNDARAQYELARRYENGIGIQKDEKEASRLYSLAANQGFEKVKVSDIPIAFGKEMWATYLGDIGVEPPLPPDIKAILSAPCPFFSGKKVEETHLLVLIPKQSIASP